MSVWDNYAGATTLPPATPDIRIRSAGTPVQIRVFADGQQVHVCDQYQDAHRWVMNTYRLTRTMMMPIYEEYASSKTRSS